MGIEKFCGSEFFDTDLLEGDWPQFTQCFQVTALYWAPLGYLLIANIFYLYGFFTLRKQDTDYLSPSWLHLVKIAISGILAGLTFLDMGESDMTDYQAYVIDPFLRGIAMLWTIAMMEMDRTVGRHNNGFLCIFWLLMIACGIIPFYSEIKVQSFSDYWHVSFYIQFGFWFLQLILSNFAEKVPVKECMVNEKHPIPCPVTYAPFFSYTTYSWMDKLMLTGWKKFLTETDLWALNPENQILGLGERFEKLLKVQKEKSEKRKLEYYSKLAIETNNPNLVAQVNGEANFTDTLRSDVDLAHSLSPTEVSETQSLLGKNGKKGKKEGPPDFTPSVFNVLVKQFGPDLMKAWACKLVYDCLQFANPQILNLIINFTNSDEPIWRGIVYSFAFMLTAILCSQFFHQLFYIGMCVGMRMKSAIISAIYKKAIVMSNDAKRGSTVGEIVNLMSIDSDRINLAVGYLWVVWSAPFQIIVAMIFLWFQVQQAMLGGLAIIVLSVPINFFLASIQRRLQVGQLKFKDHRIRQMGEILNGIKVIKLYAWEPPFFDRICKTRTKEVSFLMKAAYLNGFNTFTWTFLPFLVMITTFMIYVYAMGEPLTADKAFVTVSLFNILRAPLNILPMLVAFLVQAMVSLKRIARFLNHGDIDMSSISREPDDKYPVKMTNCTLSWSSNLGLGGISNATLKDISFKVERGTLTAVVGTVGAGKSSLVTSLLGDLKKLSGDINVDGRVAYVSQQAWIQNLTLRENILFGKKFKDDKYDAVLEACALKPDLEILPGGDQTEIGEKGINLSGGQKQRVNIARAVYQNSDIYLLDDPLSAVDSHVGKHLFDRVVGPHGILKSKTRVLVTHGLSFLRSVDNVIFMKDGKIEAQGTFHDLMEDVESFKSFVQSANLAEEEKQSADLEASGSSHGSGLSESFDGGRERSASQVKRRDEIRAFKEEKKIRKRRLMRSISVIEGDVQLPIDFGAAVKDAEDKDREREQEGKLTEKELAEEGNIRLSIFGDYIKAIGVVKFIVSFSLFVCYQGSSLFASLWLTAWSDWTQDQIDENPDNYTLGSQQNVYAGIYGLSGALQAIFILLYGLIFSVALVQASAKLHVRLLDNILRCPMSFYDSVPSGRTLNRFSKDVEVTDNTLPQTVRSFLTTISTVIQIFILISYSTPIFLVFLLPLSGFYWFVQRFYVKTSRQLKRVESTTRSPIFNHFSETLTGTSVIRAYNASDRFIEDNHNRVDENNIYYYAGSIVAARWLGIRLEFLGSLIVLAASLLAVLSRNHLDPGVVGLAVSSSLQITGSLNWSVRMMSDLESYIVSVERIREYTEVENEAAWERPSHRPPPQWPDKGRVTFSEYSTRYRKDLPLVLNGISCQVQAGEKVGIVGRTGAGKSSLTLALFRIIEASDGMISMDGINIADLGLHDLRKKLTILPQDPVLFSGSIRENLDPFATYNDELIWGSLENAHLKDFATEKEEGLTYEVGEGGANLSVGQRQLVCLARALLHKTLILILDEATAAVDPETDDLIQKTIRAQFKECTILTIAHRLNTIIDYDRVMVLSDGKIKEFDNPQSLLEDTDSQFYSMAVDAGIVGGSAPEKS